MKGLIQHATQLKKTKKENSSIYKHVIVHFCCYEDMLIFSNLIKQPITVKTKAIWFSLDKKIKTFIDVLPKKSHGIFNLLDLEQTHLVKEWEHEWKNMPEFNQFDLMPFKSIIVNFELLKDLTAFENLVEQKIGPKTKSIWHPEAEIAQMMNKRYIDES